MEMIRAGPVGMRDILSYNNKDWDEKGHTMISHIYVSFDENRITSIQFGYLENGALVLSAKYGSSSGHNFRVVRLNEDEYVTGLSGVYSRSNKTIRNLIFQTNHAKHGPIGCLDCNYSDCIKAEIDPAIRDRREFGGFFGSYSSCTGFLTSIGINVNPIATSNTVVKREKI